jgi:hypothetical protein
MTDYATELLRRQLHGESPGISGLRIANLISNSLWVVSPELNRNPPEGVSVGLVDDDNIFEWELLIVGPPDTLYEVRA